MALFRHFPDIYDGAIDTYVKQHYALDMSSVHASKEAWMAAAYQALTEYGVDSVKIMSLAKRLGMTRTGFYWHFKDRDALLEEMVRAWETKNTGNLVARTSAYAETITEAMFNLFDCWLDDVLFDAKLDLAIRNWARKDSSLQARLDKADAARAEAIATMFRHFGYPETQANVRAMSVIYTQIGYISMQVKEDLQTRLARMPDYIEVFTGQKPTRPEIDRFMSRYPAD
jgi:AcrR family transcriptional regulator